MKYMKTTQAQKPKEQPQGWDGVAHWYDSYLSGPDTFQEKVIAPNVLRMLNIKKGEQLLDLACGQGYFSVLCAKEGAVVTGVDVSSVLIKKAEEAVAKSAPFAGKDTSVPTYIVASADSTGLKDSTFAVGLIVLALENIAQTQAVITELSRVLAPQGRAVVVLLHPSFRIPQHADWQYNTKKGVQQRVVDRYLSECVIAIKERPHSGGGFTAKETKTATTYTYHRSLQWYSKSFRNAGFAITSIEEWISHKNSQPGPKQKIEDVARKEFPMFMALELRKI